MLRFACWLGLGLALAPACAGAAAARSAAETMDILMWNREPVGGPFVL
ncbi:MAG: SCO family protein, partial [Bradyrhizobium canariense]